MTGDRGAIGFAERLLALLDEGKFSTTYKYAVLLGMIDLCLQQTSKSGAAPTVLTTRQLAEKVIEIYWPHATPFGQNAAAVLRQSAMGQAEALAAIERFRTASIGDRATTLAQARARAPERFQRLVSLVEWKLIEMPLLRLQRIGDSEDRFIYAIGWTSSVKKGEVADTGSFDNRILLLDRVGEYLVQLNGLLRPLIQRQWAAKVAQVNSDLVGEAHLEEHLFGAERISLDPVRGDLRELQGNRCFYCDCRMTGPVHVDHFLPWSRHPDNGIDNLVAADVGCNGAKRDFLASAEHVQRWVERARASDAVLTTIIVKAEWERHSERTLSVARAIYTRLPDQARLWRVRKEFVALDRGVLDRVLGSNV